VTDRKEILQRFGKDSHPEKRRTAISAKTKPTNRVIARITRCTSLMALTLKVVMDVLFRC